MQDQQPWSDSPIIGDKGINKVAYRYLFVLYMTESSFDLGQYPKEEASKTLPHKTKKKSMSLFRA